MRTAAFVRGTVELTRPVNAIVAGVLTFIGSFVAAGSTLPPVPVAAAIGATILATGAGNAINDYFDREIDRINNPDRPIPREAVSPRWSLLFSVLLFVSAVVLTVAALPVLAIIIAVVNLLALVTYTELFKGLPGVGNALVAYLGGSTFLFGGAAVGSLNSTVAVLFLLAALSTVSREIIKDVEDIAGDREEGLRTLPIVLGEQRALQLAVGLLLVAVLVSPIPYLGALGVSYLVVVVPADAIMLYAAYESFGDAGTGQSYLKYGMFLAAVAFVVGRVTPLL